MTPRVRPLAHLGLLYCALIWGPTFTIVKDALDEVDPLALVGYRFLIAAAVLAPVIAASPAASRSLRKSDVLGQGAVLGSCLGTALIMQTVGLIYTSAANSGFITGLFVVFVPLFLLIGVRQPLSGAQWSACGLAVVGLWLLTGQGTGFNLGDCLTLVTAVAYAAQLLAAGRFSRTPADPLVLAFHQFWVVGVTSLCLALLLSRPLGIGTTHTMWVIVMLGLLPTLSAFVIQLFAQRHVAAMTVTMIFLLEPVFAALYAWTAGGEHVVASRVLGGGLIVAAMAWTQLAKSSAPETATEVSGQPAAAPEFRN